MHKTALITGAAGMIGSHLCDELMSTGEYHVVAVDDLSIGKLDNLGHHLDSPHFRFVRGDIRDWGLIRAAGQGVDVICHLAARKKTGESQPSIETLTVNTRGTEALLDLAREQGAKFILGSTSDVYGMSPDLPFREDGDLVLGPSMIKRWSYAVSKLYSEQLAFGYYKDFGVDVVILRYFGGFSDRASFSWSGGHVPLFIDAILKGEPVIVHGDGSQTRSMGHVDDLVAGTMLAMESAEAVGEVINLGNPEEVSVLECARRIHNMAGDGGELAVTYVPFEDIFGRYKDIERRRPDIGKAERLLGWKPKLSLEDALRRTIEARREYLRSPTVPTGT